MTLIKNEIILFDGVCNFCNSSVNFIIDNDRRNIFRFASLQSDFGQNQLRKFSLPAESFSTLILLSNGKYFTRSSAALRIAKELSFPYSLLFAFIVIPPFIRNFFYDIISRNRYRWFGKRDACRIPSPEERAKFIE